MSRPLKLALRSAALLAALALVPALLAPGSPRNHPYVSALSDLVAPAAQAAGCSHKSCQFVHGKIACARSTEAENCKAGQGFCESKPCPV